MFGISLLRREVPDALIQSYRLQGRIARRTKDSDEELLFFDQHDFPRLPVWMEGQLRFLPWGNRTSQSLLPRTHWCPFESLDAGNWSSLQPVEVVVPASFGCDRGVWYLITEGIRGVVVKDRQQQVVYPISTQATHYYEVMTRNRRMPNFVGETI
ncbi:hypothetical protein [Thalassoglobus polymorphus]|uniref:Uncharacterized protein n=1 Tax=Thalassoglobus polymorphus TaxID=2527994 RepID=A0A517QLJ4_9PLAN|nr:hypothetical protein [Thalassoglobus polymorphus]QDT32493.1 hypothetical protein Mal48_17390 [Thalassoglobus polymorphus]